MAERGPDLGITKIDLEKGRQDYKRRFRNASATVATGSVEVLLQHGAEDPPPDLSQLHSQHPRAADLVRRAKRLLCRIRPTSA